MFVRKSQPCGIACALAALLCGIFFGCNKAPDLPPKVERVPDLSEVKSKAERGDADAQNTFGELYAKGQGSTPNYKEAAAWFRKAADQGNLAAQNNLGTLYEAGQGVPVDYAEAAKWYRRAAEQGYRDAQYNLAAMYTFGRGVPNDIAEAVKWFRLAAEAGDGLAQYNLGQRYRIAKGVPQDLVEAYKWLSLAAAQGTPDAAKERDAMKGSLTREQISEAQRRVREFVPKKLEPISAK
jgi:TPR repeat protein